ncbi:MAG: hypothetical protein HRU11_11845 [Parvularculaceae bacterium]|nr:hypothetical protein [Parvularculaceae bacterium]
MRVGIGFFATMAVIAAVTMLLHELVHAGVALALGADAVGVGLTRMRYVGDLSPIQQQIVSLAGPAFTLGLGFYGAYLAIVKRAALGYELIFVAAFQRTVAMGMSHFTGVHNDEARVSLFFGFDWWVLPAIAVIPAWILFFWSSARLRFGPLTFFLSYVTLSLTYTAIVALDGQLPGGGGACGGVLVPFWPEALGCSS